MPVSLPSLCAHILSSAPSPCCCSAIAPLEPNRNEHDPERPPMFPCTRSVFLSWREGLRARLTLDEAMLALRVNPSVTPGDTSATPVAPQTTLVPRTGRRSSVGAGPKADTQPRRRSSVDAPTGRTSHAAVKSSGYVGLVHLGLHVFVAQHCLSVPAL